MRQSQSKSVSHSESITATGAMKACGRGRGVVVDARPQVRRHQGSVPGAVVVEPDEVRRAFGAGPGRGWVLADRDAEIAVVAVPSQAARIVDEISELGYTNVHYVDGGYAAIDRVRRREQDR